MLNLIYDIRQRLEEEEKLVENVYCVLRNGCIAATFLNILINHDCAFMSHKHPQNDDKMHFKRNTLCVSFV